MIKLYFRQAWQLLKQNRLYSTVYVVGTGLAIAMIMIIAIIYFVKIAPFYPETNRNRTLAFRNMNVNYAGGAMASSSLSYSFIREHLYTLKEAEAATAMLSTYGETNYVEQGETGKLIPVTIKYTDVNFWRVFDFEFINGKPFGQAEFQSAMHTVVISAAIAKKAFGTTQAEGKTITIDSNQYRVAGVVRDATYATPLTCAQIYMPFTLRAEEVNQAYGEGLLGSMSAYILAPTAAARTKVKDEVTEIIRKIANSQDNYTINATGQPEELWKTGFRKYSNIAIDWWEIFSTFGIMLLALLIVPAVNLAGMVSSRMEKRLAEVGVRKAFGASSGTLINQMLVENLLLTLLGGLAGLIMAWMVVYGARYWIFTLFDSWPQLPPEGMDSLLPAGILFSPAIFMIALVICLTLNLLSAIIPAWNAMRKDIVYSLNEKK
ncbi:ABC transporter permease [Bacteroides sp. OttesenSCG-928-D19]|nr:ABC transporter permease [Bacteroides sp. OttesenSCG-928-D19]